MWFLRRQGLDAKAAVASTFSEYLIYTLASAGFGIGGLTYLLSKFGLPGGVAVAAWAIVAVMSAFLLAAIFAIIFRIYLIGGMIQLARKLPVIRNHLPFAAQDVRETEDLLLVVLRDRPWLLPFILVVEIGAQALLVMEVFLVLRAMREFTSVLDPVLIEGGSKFTALAFFFIPGQVGAAESVYTLIFNALGLPAAAGFALALTRRIRSLVFSGIGLAVTPRA